MKRLKLEVQKRQVLGKKVKKLRREEILPANIYGKEVKSQAVQVPVKEFDKVYQEAGETGLIDLAIDSEIRPVLIHHVQLDPRTGLPLHADFYQVNLKEKIKAMIPVVAVGEPAAVTDKIGLLLQPLSEVEVEALPEDLPEKIEVNVESLAVVDEQIMVGDLKIPQGVAILSDEGQIVFKIGELVTKEAEALAAQEQAQAEAAKAETAEAPPAEAEAAPAPPAGEETPPKTAEEAKPEQESKSQ